jgi:hypothetical protein
MRHDSARVLTGVTAVAASLAVATAGCGSHSRSAGLSAGDLPAIVAQPPKAEGRGGDWTPLEKFETQISRKELGQSAATKGLIHQGFVGGERRAWEDGVNAGVSVFLFEDAAGAKRGLDTLETLIVESFKGDGTVEVTTDEIDTGKLGDASLGWHVKGADEGFFYLWRGDNAVYTAFMQAVEGDLSEPEQVRSEARAYAKAVNDRAEARH